jgi:hypothetical protein
MRWATGRHPGGMTGLSMGIWKTVLRLVGAGRERILVLARSAQSGLGHPGIQPVIASRAGRSWGGWSFRSAWRAPWRRRVVESLALLRRLKTVLGSHHRVRLEDAFSWDRSEIGSHWRCPEGHRLAIPSHETRSQHFLCGTDLARRFARVNDLTFQIDIGRAFIASFLLLAEGTSLYDSS